MRTEVSCHKEYLSEVGRQFNPYHEWISENESYEGFRPHKELTYRILFMEECAGNWNVTKYNEDILILYSMKGELAERAIDVILEFMAENEKVALAYADEDYLVDEELLKKRKNDAVLYQLGVDVEHLDEKINGRFAPWFKPDFSPDTLLSFQYFGNIVVLRTKRVRMANVDVLNTPDSFINLYDFFLRLSEKAQIAHIPEILYHRHGLPSITMIHGARKKYNLIKSDALQRRGLRGQFAVDEDGYSHIRYEIKAKPLVSVIIPTKDHPELLKTCLQSMESHKKYTQYEVIVVDNGSSSNNKLVIEELREKYHFTYLYETMEFNFSKMCNMGAEHAKGEFLLFLNDDIEILQDDWLEIMLGQAQQKHVGAVGVKLLYPRNHLIQHVGISNIVAGPVHRLHNYSDENSLYYGRNRVTYNYIGVTAACMLMRREVFEEARGFCEEIKVAYNDVDLCFTLHELGYTQVVRNDVKMYHHESISRGKDSSLEKKARLDRERELLYSRHPQLSPKYLEEKKVDFIDPYCKNTEEWKRNSLFICGYQYEYERRDCVNTARKAIGSMNLSRNFPGKITYQYLMNPKCAPWDRSHVMISVDSRSKEDGQLLMKGWALVTKNDNALFEKYLLLRSQNDIYLVKPYEMLREDVVERIEGQTNVYLSGFVVRLEEPELPPGDYQIGALFLSKTSGKKYAGYSEEYWTIE